MWYGKNCGMRNGGRNGIWGVGSDMESSQVCGMVGGMEYGLAYGTGSLVGCGEDCEMVCDIG